MPPDLPAAVAGQIDDKRIHKSSRRWIAFVASSVGFAGTFDPQVCVGVRARGCRGGRNTQRPTVGIAPVQRRVGCRSVAVARGVDHVVLTVGETRNRFAVTDFLLSGEEVRDVEAEASRVLDTGLAEPGGHLLGAVPAQLTRVDVYGRCRIAG